MLLDERATEQEGMGMWGYTAEMYIQKASKEQKMKSLFRHRRRRKKEKGEEEEYCTYVILRV